MHSKQKGLLLCIPFLSLMSSTVFADQPQTPCDGGDTALLAILDRPSIADSTCVVPEKNALLETGYQYQSLTGGGIQQNVPQAVFRVGLANKFEFNVALPNYIHQTVAPRIGFTQTTFALKHELASSKKWVVTVEGYLTPPSGSASFGTKEFGGNAIVLASYNLTSEFSVTGMLGASSQSLPINYGGQSFTSLNPDLVLSWSKNKVSLYGEVYGQSKTAPQEGSGFNMDAGVIYLLKKNIAVDLEVGRRISGSLYNFNYYLGTGISIQFC